MILVTGANGQLGTAVVQNLLKKTSATQIAALVRDESKASALKEKGVDIRVGNYDDTASLDKAMQGIDKVLLIARTDEDNRLQQHQNVVDAAKKAGVQCIAYTSRSLKDRNTLANKLMKGHFQAEDSIKECGLNYAIFRNVLYMDTIPQLVGERVFDTGINLPTNQGRVPFALRSEMGEAIANALLESDRSNQIYKLTGSESYSFNDVAAILSDLSGKEVAYTPAEKLAFERMSEKSRLLSDPPPKSPILRDFERGLARKSPKMGGWGASVRIFDTSQTSSEAQMKERGVPETMIEKITGFLTDIKNGQEEEVSPDLENLLGRKPASLREGLKALFNL